MFGNHGCGFFERRRRNALVVASGALRREQLPTARASRFGDSVTGVIVREEQPHRLDDYTTAPARDRRRRSALRVHSAVGCPILVGDQIWAPSSGDIRRRAVPARHRAATRAFADLAAPAIAMRRRGPRVEQLADERRRCGESRRSSRAESIRDPCSTLSPARQRRSSALTSRLWSGSRATGRSP